MVTMGLAGPKTAAEGYKTFARLVQVVPLLGSLVSGISVSYLCQAPAPTPCDLKKEKTELSEQVRSLFDIPRPLQVPMQRPAAI